MIQSTDITLYQTIAIFQNQYSIIKNWPFDGIITICILVYGKMTLLIIEYRMWKIDIDGYVYICVLCSHYVNEYIVRIFSLFGPDAF